MGFGRDGDSKKLTVDMQSIGSRSCSRCAFFNSGLDAQSFSKGGNGQVPPKEMGGPRSTRE